MSDYRTEEEQLQNIKKWWIKYSTPITLVFSIVLLGFSGYKYWQWNQEKTFTQASNTYEQMMVAYANKNERAIESYANLLISDYSKTVYSDVALLLKAKLKVENDKLDEAKILLENLALHARMQALKQVANLDISRLLIAKKDYQAALKQLTVVRDKTYLPLINELKGDIYAATGKYKEAALAYQQAFSGVRTHGMGNLFLEMKTNELAALTHKMQSENGSALAIQKLFTS